jgi:hypothetical protein
MQVCSSYLLGKYSLVCGSSRQITQTENNHQKSVCVAMYNNIDMVVKGNPRYVHRL